MRPGQSNRKLDPEIGEIQQRHGAAEGSTVFHSSRISRRYQARVGLNAIHDELEFIQEQLARVRPSSVASPRSMQAPPYPHHRRVNDKRAHDRGVRRRDHVAVTSGGDTAGEAGCECKGDMPR